jgi:hypothetical protein
LRVPSFPVPVARDRERRKKGKKGSKLNIVVYLFRRVRFGEGETSPAPPARHVTCLAAELMRRGKRSARLPLRARAVRGTAVSLRVFRTPRPVRAVRWNRLDLGLYVPRRGSGDGSSTPLLASLSGFLQPERSSQERRPPFPVLHTANLSALAMADRVTIISPRDPWPFSTVTAGDLEDLVDEGLLRPLTDKERPEWIPPTGGAAPSPPPGYVVSFISFHERGFGVPSSRFMRALLFHYGVELHNLTPNSVVQAAIFVAVCEGYLGIAPHWDLWTHLFFAELFASSTGERKVPAAVRASGCTLLLRQLRALQYIPAVLSSSNKGWQRRWFYLRNDGGSLPPFSQRIVTAAPNAWRHGTPHERQKNLEPLLQALKALREEGLTVAGVVAAIHRRRVLPLAERRLSL